MPVWEPSRVIPGRSSSPLSLRFPHGCVLTPPPRCPSPSFPGHLSAPVNSGDQLAGNGPFWEEHWSFSNRFGEETQNQKKRGHFHLLSCWLLGSRDSGDLALETIVPVETRHVCRSPFCLGHLGCFPGRRNSSKVEICMHAT